MNIKTGYTTQTQIKQLGKISHTKCSDESLCYQDDRRSSKSVTRIYSNTTTQICTNSDKVLARHGDLLLANECCAGKETELWCVV